MHNAVAASEHPAAARAAQAGQAEQRAARGGRRAVKGSAKSQPEPSAGGVAPFLWVR